MNTFPLTPEGASQLIEELYALPQTELQIEADAAGADFPEWVKSHFNLDQSQQNYLDGIDERWIETAASETKHALENRLPITLEKDPSGKSGEEEGDRGKLLDLDKKKQSSFSPANGFSESETLGFTISYPGNR